MVAAAWAGDFIPGDVNDDGVFDIVDPTVLRRDLAGLGPGISQAVLCGNGVLDAGEECDSGVICADLGFAFGELDCGAGCVAEANTCTNDRFEDLGLTVFDHQTGLEWEKKTGSLGPTTACILFVCFPINDVNHHYDWSRAGGEWLSRLKGFAGHSDWRIPTLAELLTIVDPSAPDCGFSPFPPCIDLIFGPTHLSFYWSSTLSDTIANGAWGVSFRNGVAQELDASQGFSSEFVRAVRSGPPTCGDGLLNQASEECDSPNDSACPGACSSDCTCLAPPTCGDGVPDPGEECDDGNTQSGHCCSSTCLFEASSVVCRSTAGACDVPEFCTGGNASCPSDRIADQGTPCDDGVGCTAGDECDGGGVCVGGLIDCSALDGPCTVGICNEASATCVADPTPLEGAPCDDGVVCTTASTCNAGFCSGGIPASCDDRNVCTDDFCDPVRGCQNAPIIDGTPCDDGLFCTTGDICTVGACGGRARDCSGVDSSCAEGVCDEAGNVCVAGVCEDFRCGPLFPSGSCPPGDLCVAGVCEVFVCGPTFPSGPCPPGEQCVDNVCQVPP